MNDSSNAVLKSSSNEKELVAFRSETTRSNVNMKPRNISNLSGLGKGGVRVSEYKLEEYLNACSPTCHG